MAEEKKESEENVPDSTFFCLDTKRNIFVGAVNIRHYLNEKLLLGGGHIGDGIRPSERGKGYGTKMIALALEECRKLGIDRVLMCCDKDNPASAKTIIKNRGVLENEVMDEGSLMQRYWIEINTDLFTGKVDDVCQVLKELVTAADDEVSAITDQSGRKLRSGTCRRCDCRARS